MLAMEGGRAKSRILLIVEWMESADVKHTTKDRELYRVDL